MKFYAHITVEFQAPSKATAERELEGAVNYMLDWFEDSCIPAESHDRLLTRQEFEEDRKLLEEFVRRDQLTEAVKGEPR